MSNIPSLELAVGRLQRNIESNAQQRANAVFDEFDFQRERNERSGIVQLQGFASSNLSLATFGDMSGSTMGP